MEHKCGSSEFGISGGRRKYNKRRQQIALLRQSQIAKRLRGIDVTVRGWRTELAIEFDVSIQTISRDVDAIQRIAKQENRERQEKILERRETYMNRVRESLSHERGTFVNSIHESFDRGREKSASERNR